MLRFSIGLLGVLVAYFVFGLLLLWLSVTSPGWTFFSVLIVIPGFIFFYAIIPALRGLSSGKSEAEKVYEFCYGGMTYTFVLTSTLGTVLTIGSVLNGTLGSLRFNGNAPFIGWLAAIPTFSILLYFLISSVPVRAYFSSVSDARGKMRTVVGYIADHYGPRANWFVGGMFILTVLSLGFLETGFILLWSDSLFSARFPHAWLLPLLWVTIVLTYVFFGGYRLVLRTDFIQFFLLLFAFSFLAVLLFWVFGTSTAVDVIIQAAIGGFIDSNKMIEIIAERDLRSSPTAAQANILSAVASFVIMGLWFVAVPDTWNRLTQFFYVQIEASRKPSKVIDTFGRTKQGLIILFVAVATCLALADLPSGYLGSYSFTNAQEMGLVAKPYNAPYDGVSFVSKALSARQVPNFPMLSGSLGTLFVLLVLTVILMLGMTTLNTMVITAVQLLYDLRQVGGVGPRNASLLGQRIVALLFLSSFSGLAFLLYLILGFDLFNRAAITLGLLVLGTALIMLTFMLFMRTWVPNVFRGDDIGFVYAFAMSFFLSKVVWGSFLVSGGNVGWLNFEFGAGTLVGSVFVVEICTYALVLFGFCIFRRVVPAIV